MVGTFGTAARDPAINRTKPSFLTLFHGYFEPFSFPESVDSFEIDRPTFLAEQACDHPITVTRKLADQFKNTSNQTGFVVFDTALITGVGRSLGKPDVQTRHRSAQSCRLPHVVESGLEVSLGGNFQDPLVQLGFR